MLKQIIILLTKKISCNFSIYLGHVSKFFAHNLTLIFVGSLSLDYMQKTSGTLPS